MPKHGKKYRNKVEGVDRTIVRTIDEVMKQVVASSYVSFDETVDIAAKLGVDPRHADQMVRGTVVLQSCCRTAPEK